MIIAKRYSGLKKNCIHFFKCRDTDLKNGWINVQDDFSMAKNRRDFSVKCFYFKSIGLGEQI